MYYPVSIIVIINFPVIVSVFYVIQTRLVVVCLFVCLFVYYCIREIETRISINVVCTSLFMVTKKVLISK